MKAVDGAKKLSSDSIKPIDNRGEGSCPCAMFIRCSSRIPYGQKVWSSSKKKQQACGEIVYSAAVPKLSKDEIKKCMEICSAILRRDAAKMSPPRNDYKTLDRGAGKRVMAFPKITEGQLQTELAAAKAGMCNTASYTPFQKTMILRANLVKNGLALVSDIYYKDSEEVQYGAEKLTPFNKKPLGLEWNIDHIQTRGKGGCSRFCNAGLLSRNNNVLDKHDKGLGCVCADALAPGNQAPYQEEFEYIGVHAKKVKLYNCSAFSLNKKNKEEHQPDKPLGAMMIYPTLCEPDSPLDKFRPNPVEGRANKKCGK